MTPNELEDIQREMFSSYLCEEISGRVALGMFFDADGEVAYDTEEITVTDHDNEPWTPLTVEGMATAHIGDTETEVYLNWTARFTGKTENKLTYKVQREDGGLC